MYRAYGSQALTGGGNNGLKSVVTKHVEPTALHLRRLMRFLLFGFDAKLLPLLGKSLSLFGTQEPVEEEKGLHLSLNDDMIKGSGGEIKVDTKEGEGTVFFIQQPLN